MRGDCDGAPLADTNADQTLVHAGNHVASAHVGVVGTIARVAAGRKILTKVLLRCCIQGKLTVIGTPNTVLIAYTCSGLSLNHI